MKRLCVFCGSSVGVRPEYVDVARALGESLAARGLGLVYGGGSIGLMGAVADAALARGGEVIGVIPRPLARREVAHAGLTEMHVVESMHDRKAKMASLVNGFVSLPGGLGTFEETLEILTWSQLGIHRKPVALLNVAGYYDHLIRMLTHAVREGFVRREYFDLLLFGETVDGVLDAALAWTPPALPAPWIQPSQT